ncbi:MAG: minor capsid protein [Nitrospinota bacterium]
MLEGKTQSDLIAQVIKKAVKTRDKYVQTQIDQLVDVLETAENEVKASLLHYKNLGSLTKGKFLSQKSQKRLRGQIREITGELKKNHSLIMTKAVKTTYKKGMYDGIDSLVKGKLPDYADLTDKGMRKLTTNVFSLVDTNALDFLINFNVQLAGEVSNELANGIMQKIQLGIASGKDVTDIVRDMGSVIKDPEAFKQAGKRTFNTAQQRMTLIARTEIIRAHNQSQIKFYEKVGVKKFIWQTADDERTCPVCQPLDEKSFAIDKPGPPRHPACRCWSEPEIPDTLRTPKQFEADANKKKPPVSPKLTKAEQDIEQLYRKFSKGRQDPDKLFSEIFPDKSEREIVERFDKQWKSYSNSNEGRSLKYLMDKIHDSSILYDGRYLDSDQERIAERIRRTKKFMGSIHLPENKALEMVKKLEAYSRVQYERQFGKKSIKIYRGVTRDFFEDQGLPVPTLNQKSTVLTDSLTSWTTSKEEAGIFAKTATFESKGGYVFETEISVKDIGFIPIKSKEQEIVLKQAKRNIKFVKVEE